MEVRHSQKKVFRTNGRTAALPSLLERQTEYTHRRVEYRSNTLNRGDSI